MQNRNEIKISFNTTSIIKSAVIGGAIGLALIGIFLLGVKHSDPSWPKYWQIRPLVIVPIASGCGGVFFYFMSTLVKNNAWVKLLATLIGIIGFIISLWLGTVLGLDGTLWN